jgi:hypothetical protein
MAEHGIIYQGDAGTQGRQIDSRVGQRWLRTPVMHAVASTRCSSDAFGVVADG